jgi:hypothetical protein
MTALVSYSTGTVSVAASGTTVTGVGTLWAGTVVKPGDILQIGNFQTVISDVTDTTHLVIPPWGGGVQSAVAYKIWQVSPQRFAGAQAMQTVNDLVAAFNTSGYFVFVSSTATVPDPSLGSDGQYAFQPTTGKTWAKVAGVWSFLGVYKAFNLTGAYNGSTTYSYGDVQVTSGSSYIYINATPSAGNAAPNATYWQLLASVGVAGAAGAVPWSVPADWVTATAYVVGPPASIVRHPTTRNLYQCLIAHTSGTFATDLAAGKWLLVEQSLTEGTSATSLLIANSTSKVFTSQVDLSYQNGVRLRASSAANVANWMEGVCSYVASTGVVTMTVDKIGGSGTFADWLFNRIGQPGSGDVTASNNLTDLGNVNTALINLGGVSYNLNQGATAAQKSQARANIGVQKKNYLLNSGMQVSQENGTTAGTVSAFYPVDQFTLSTSTSGTFSAAQVASTTPGGSPNRIRYTVTAADAAVGASDIVLIQTRLEGLRVADLLFGTASAKSITIQFGVKAPAGTYGVSVINGAANRAYVGEYTISGGEANTSVVKSVTLTGDTTGTWAVDSTIAMYISWTLMAGSTYQTAAGSFGAGNFYGTSNQFNLMGTNGNVFELFDVGLYEGTAAPAFQLPEFESELRLCKRYWRKSYPYASAPGAAVQTGMVSCGMNDGTGTNAASVSFDVPMRAAPTLAYWDGNGNGSKISYLTSNTSTWNHNSTTGVAPFNASESGFIASGPNAVAHVAGFIHYTANARL